MDNRRFKPKIDKLYWIPLIFTLIALLAVTVMAVLDPPVLFLIIPIDLFCLYFFISPLYGYVELRESTLFIKFGLILSREIPYAKIRGTARGRGWYGEAFLTLKYAMEHLHIRYGVCDITTVSVKDNDALALALQQRISSSEDQK